LETHSEPTILTSRVELTTVLHLAHHYLYDRCPRISALRRIESFSSAISKCRQRVKNETVEGVVRMVSFEPSPEIQASDREFPLSERRQLLCTRPQSYKLDNLVFTNVSTAIDRNPGVCCDKGRRLMAQKNPHAGLPDPWRPRPNQSR
jgi:hypothetical protein